ncbi:MAG: type I-C CRISPR-associated protein Cas8c/Csd1, partial [Acidobacteria bacterium]|nr:type I-C CRISPR-associated protein Cas8c/Csd1 [Acidobacteriota bacterium]
MLLQKLVEYADRIERTPPLYTERPIRYVIELDSAGNLLGLTDTADSSDRRSRNGARRLAPQVQRSVAVKPLLLSDRADYTFGRPRGADTEEQALKRHQAYMGVLERCAAATGEPGVAAVQRFLRNAPLGAIQLGGEFDESAYLTFRVDGAFVIDLPSVQEFWANEHSLGGETGNSTQCLVCGREGPVLGRLPSNIKGIPGGQSSGTALISANEEAFESYGLEASRVAPTCESCAEKFTKALNALLATKANNYRFRRVVFIFWTREESGFSFQSFLERPDAEEVWALMASVRTGKALAHLDETAFYAASLSSSGGRAVVRDWTDTTVGGVKRNLARWFGMQRVTGWDGSGPQPLSLYQLAGAAVRDMKDLPTPTIRAMLRTAFTGAPLPLSLVAQAVRRNQAEQRVTHARAALIKLALMGRNNDYDYEEDDMVSLNEEHPSAA